MVDILYGKYNGKYYLFSGIISLSLRSFLSYSLHCFVSFSRSISASIYLYLRLSVSSCVLLSLFILGSLQCKIIVEGDFIMSAFPPLFLRFPSPPSSVFSLALLSGFLFYCLFALFLFPLGPLHFLHCFVIALLQK